MKLTSISIIKKIFNIIGGLVTLFVVAFAVILAGFTLFGEKDADGTTIIFDKQIRLVTTSSMAKSEFTDVSKYDIKSIPVNAVVFIEMVPKEKEEALEWYEDLEEGDVLTFKYVYDSQVVITHRLVKKEKLSDGNFKLYLEGDNKNSDTNILRQVIDTSNPESGNYVIGKVVGKSLVLGYLLTLVKNPKILIFVLILVIVIIFSIKKIIKVLKQTSEVHDEQKNIDDELKELKEKVEKLLEENK